MNISLKNEGSPAGSLSKLLQIQWQKTCSLVELKIQLNLVPRNFYDDNKYDTIMFILEFFHFF